MGDYFSQTRGLAVCPGPLKNFFGVGGGPRNPAPTPVRAPGHVPERGRSFPEKSAQKFRRFLPCSVMVFRLWQEWQRLCRFDRSVNSSQSPLWSRMWSTSVAGVRMPRAAHARQKGSRRSCPGRRSSVQIFSEYHRRHAAASGDLGASLGLCWGHQPSRDRVPHPGWRQGRSGFCAMGCHLRAKQKRRSPCTSPKGVMGSGAQRSGLSQYPGSALSCSPCSTRAGCGPLCRRRSASSVGSVYRPGK